DGKPAGLADAGTYFHTDFSYLEMPARATMLYSIEVPRAGGDTLFANQYAAYDDLPGAMKKRLEGLVGLHHYGNRDDLEETSRTAASLLTGEQKRKLHWVRHPVARRHPVTGRTALYAVSGSSFGIEGMPEGEARAIAQTITLHGAVQFNDDHAFNKALLRFEALVKKYYDKPVTFVLHKNSELGLEKDYFAYMNQGKAVDYGIVSPAHMSTFSKAAPFIDAPFLFRDLGHWNKVLDADLL